MLLKLVKHNNFGLLECINDKTIHSLQVCINVPVFMDKNTVDPVEAETSLLHGETQEEQSRYFLQKQLGHSGHVKYRRGLQINIGIVSLVIILINLGMLLSQDMFSWMLWDSVWAFLAYKLHFKHVAFRKRRHCTIS